MKKGNVRKAKIEKNIERIKRNIIGLTSLFSSLTKLFEIAQNTRVITNQFEPLARNVIILENLMLFSYEVIKAPINDTKKNK